MFSAQTNLYLLSITSLNKAPETVLRCLVKQRSVDISTQWSYTGAVVFFHQPYNPITKIIFASHDSDMEWRILAAGRKSKPNDLPSLDRPKLINC